MDVSQIAEFVRNVGFPIACCVVMFIQNGKLQETLTSMTASLELMNERLSKIEEVAR